MNSVTKLQSLSKENICSLQRALLLFMVDMLLIKMCQLWLQVINTKLSYSKKYVDDALFSIN